MNPVDLKLYLVTDSGYYDEKRFLDMVEKACRGGVTLLQLREKNRGGREYLRLAQAVKDGFLVDFLTVESKLKFLTEGITYDDLPEEEKEEYEATFTDENGDLPEKIESSALNEGLFNEDTIRKAYIDLGKLYYAERGMAPEGAYAALCERITASNQKIEENRAKISEIKAANDVSDDVCGCGCCSAETEGGPEEPAAPVEDPKPEEPRQ